MTRAADNFHSYRTVILAMTPGEALDLRLALRGAASKWTAIAEADDAAGKVNDARVSRDIAAEYDRLWTVVKDAFDREREARNA